MTVKEGLRGRFFGGIEVGDVYEYPPGRTVSTTYNASLTSPGSPAVEEPGAHIPHRVIEGGSHLCEPNYFVRSRPAVRQREAVDTSTSHIGFRRVVRGA